MTNERCPVCNKPFAPSGGDIACMAGYDQTCVHTGPCFRAYQDFQARMLVGVHFDVIRLVGAELDVAQQRHDPMHSAHEGWAVLREEVDELWEEVKANAPRARLRAEAIQVAAMALRFLIDVCPPEG